MVRAWLLPVIAIIVSSIAPLVGAVEIVPVQDDRSISWTLFNGTRVQAYPQPEFSVFDRTLNIVGGPATSQDSSIEAAQMSGQGHTWVNTGEAIDLRSVFDVTFEVDEVVTYALSGDLDGNRTQAELSGPNGVLFAFDGLDPCCAFATTGTLQPGVEYRLLALAESPNEDVDWDGFWQFTFTIDVPEPGTSSLIGLGIALIACAGRRRPAHHRE